MSDSDLSEIEEETTPVGTLSGPEPTKPYEPPHVENYTPEHELYQRTVISGTKSDVFCVKFAPDGHMVAAGCGDGAIRLFHSASGRLVYQFSVGVAQFATTSLAFRSPIAGSKTRNILLSGNAEGYVQHWHVTSGKCLHTIKEEGNEIYAVEYNPEGSKFATAGKDQTVRIYDEATKTRIQELSDGYANVTSGHFNRVFSLCYHPTDPNLLISGGWDNTVQVWDLRADHSVRSIYSPHICGDSVDIDGNTVLTGSWRPDKQVQLWDLRTTELEKDVPWGNDSATGKATMVYGACFGGDQKQYIAACGSDGNQCKLFDRQSSEVVGALDLPAASYCCDFAPGGRFVAFAGNYNDIRICDVVGTRESAKQ
ncbi:WD repeat-containing protein [Carpediemonas membranifera]|uniref:WD repeat-containing protein n=1 Tax=Carpediemonas membranifera TaxID=201153 RepID=A0A8J6BWA7_9EUKA|nr:WD repeat-containing protein [Carpediemonas membranifera]|eukprot:KAG9392256.1 WD repeat-containing protein [Carpediemonas membranifera]